MKKVLPATDFEMWWWDSWVYRKVVCSVKNFYHETKRGFRWHRECISKVADFDAESCFTLLLYQLEQVQKSMANGYHLECSESYAKSLRIAIRLLKRLDSGEHYSPIDRLEKKYGKLDLIKVGDFYSCRYQRETEENSEQIKAEYRDLLGRVEKTKERDLKLFWKIFAEYYQNWWD